MEYTKKCLEALEKFTKSDWEVFLFDDRSSKKLEERYSEYGKLVQRYRERIAHIEIFPPYTRATHNTFGKAVAWTHFGYMSTYGSMGNRFSEEKQYFDYLVLIDNDILVRKEGWDLQLIETWKLIDQHKDYQNTVLLTTQAPGGIMSPFGQGGEKVDIEIEGKKIRIGPCGGSGFWMVKPDYFKRVGLLPLKYLEGKDKGHDILSWQIHQKMTNSLYTAVGLWDQLSLHIGHNRSICNYLTYGKDKRKAPGDSVRADKIMKLIREEEENFKNMTLEDVIKKYDKREHQRW